MYLLIFLFIIASAGAQENPGARQTALSDSDIAFNNDVFAIFNNPAGSSQIEWQEIGIFYSPAPFGLKELSNAWAAYNYNFNSFSISSGFMTYGYELYRENRFALSFSGRPFKSVYAGTALQYNAYSIKGYGTDGVLLINAGAIAILSPEVRFGFTLSNLNQASVGNSQDQIPVIIRTGFGVNFIDQLLLNISLKKELRYKFSVSAGFEYFILQTLALRFGTSSDPVKYSAGGGIHYKYFSFDYAVTIHQQLGLTHQAGIIISFKELL